MIRPLIDGLKLTLKYFFSKKITLQYPDEKWPVAQRWRGRHFLPKHASGKVKCVACMLCATVCPANCISIEAAAEPDNRNNLQNMSLIWEDASFVDTALKCVRVKLSR